MKRTLLVSAAAASVGLGAAFFIFFAPASRDVKNTDPAEELSGSAAVPEEGLAAYFDRIGASGSDLYAVKPGDTLAKIAVRYGATTGLLAAQNGLKGDAIRAGMTLKVMKERWNLLADLSAYTLSLRAGGRVVKTYRIGAGKNNSTPAGVFKIANRLKNPAWYHDGTVAPFGSPENPLGTRWMGFDLKSYGLHGTWEPASIGRSESLGCIRMLNGDVEELFELVPVGTTITVVGPARPSRARGPASAPAGPA